MYRGMCKDQMSDGSRHKSLADYDSERLGPLFAVSDEGSAAQAIVDAAYTSAKARALAPIDPLTLGVILDGERMTSAGEVPIGPPEYEELSSIASGHLLCTTNVGVRVNARLSQLLPEFEITGNPSANAKNVIAAFTPFLETPDNRPRPLTVRLVVKHEDSLAGLKAVVNQIEARRREGRIGPSDIHRLSVLVAFDDEIKSRDQIMRIERAIDASKKAGLKEVALDGQLREAARKRLGVQSLLNILDIQDLKRLLAKAHAQGIQLTYRYQLDVESAARTVWTGLHAARTHGFSAGKYGLVPMTLDEQRGVVELISCWMAGWTAIPAFYVDTPLLTSNDVYDTSRCTEAAHLWLKMVRGAGATMVLFDSPDRITPRRLLRQEDKKDDSGVLTLKDVESLVAHAKELGVAILWSGGITSRQAFELAKRRVVGIFSTSSTAEKIAVTAQFQNDPRLPAENEPTELGVRRIHAIIQGGFLSKALSQSDHDGLTASINSLTESLIDSDPQAACTNKTLEMLQAELLRGWASMSNTALLARHGGGFTTAGSPPVPVPADAVRVFRGKRHASFPHKEFIGKLGTVFMPMTVQMQRLYGLTAYLPAIMPQNHSSVLPDEIALVFYKTQRAYYEAKRCVGGRAYSELHELVFDMKTSNSGFPELFMGDIELDTPYHIFQKSVDWQHGETRLYVGVRRQGTSLEPFKKAICQRAAQIIKSPGKLDGVIFCLSKDYLLWWEHSPQSVESVATFDNVTTAVFARTARQLRVSNDLTLPYAGLQLDVAGDFVAFRFARV